MVMRKSNHPQLLRAAADISPPSLLFTPQEPTTNTRPRERTIYAQSALRGVQPKVSAHHGATGEYGVEINRLCLESKGRGDGWDGIHAFLRQRK